MGFWRIKDYSPINSETPVQDWYEAQEDEIRLEFEFALRLLSETQDWTKTKELRALKGRHAGLYEVVINVKLFYEKKWRYYRPIGIWRPDSCDFIILIVCEKHGKIYTPPLNKALELKAHYENKAAGGVTYDREV